MNANTSNVVIIVMYNDYESTIELINQLSGFSAINKIIVVDNCSTNQSFERVKPFENDMVSVIKTDSNLGVARANNFGAEFAKQDCPKIDNYIFSNPDVLINEESIIEMTEFLDGNDDVGAVCPFELTKERELARDFAWKLPTYHQILLSELPVYIKTHQKKDKYLWYYDPKEAIKQKVFYADVLISCFIMIRASSFEEIGGFSNSTFLYHEEDILAKRMKESGKKMAVLTYITIVHYGRTSVQTSFSNWEQKSKLMQDSAEVYMKECLNTGSVGIGIYRLICKIAKIERKLFRAITRK